MTHYYNGGNRDSFAGRYHVFYIVYFECFKYTGQAIKREKEIKVWRREKKIKLIKTKNPDLKFWNDEVFGEWPPKKIH